MLLPSEPAQALDYTDIQSKLNTWQYYFCRTMMSLSLKDYFDTGVFASITCGQAFYEGGCAGAPISIIAQNHFGIRAYPSVWTGKVYDEKTNTVYNSYNDAVNLLGADAASKVIFWRAYDSWEEGVTDHSALLYAESKYRPVLAASDYKEAAKQLRLCGYCGSAGYDTNLINFIEKYGFDQLDRVTTDENGVFGLLMSDARRELAVGETLLLEAKAYPDTEAELPIVWKSDRPDVASVDENGNVTALKQGYTLITATYGDKEACCIVCVDTNAYVMNRNLAVYSKPDVDSDSLGKLLRGQPVKLNSTTVYTAEDGTRFYAVSASVGSGSLVSGYASAKDIYAGSEVKLSLGTPETILYLDEGDERQIPIEIYAEELLEKELVWASSNEEVVSVDAEGNLQALSEGVSVVTVSIDGTTALSVTVYVGSAAYEILIANQAVNLRAGPTQGAKVLGVIRAEQTVKLIGEPDDGWYHILAIIGGVPMEGYSYSRYFRREGDPPPAESSATTPSESKPTPSEDSSAAESTESEDVSSDSSDDTSSGDIHGSITYKTGVVNVDDALNVRDKPGMDGKRIARLRNGEKVVILEDDIHLSTEPVYKDWYHISFTYNGEETDGYVCAEFILLTGTVTVPVTDPPPQSEKYPIEELYVVNIPEGCTFAVFGEEFSHKVRIFRADGTELAEADTLHTGDEIRFYIGNTLIYTRTAVVKGDASGDGKLDAIDYIVVKRTYLDSYTLEGAFLRAGAITNGEEIVATDYILLKRAVLGTIDLFALE